MFKPNKIPLIQLKDSIKILKLTKSPNHVSAHAKPFDSIPGPKSFPIIGSILSMKDFGGDLDASSIFVYLNQLHQKYGNIARVNMLGKDLVYLFNPDSFKKVFSIEDNSPSRQPVEVWNHYFESTNRPLPLFHSYPERWRFLRSITNPIVARPQSAANYLNDHNIIVNDFIDMINSKIKANESFVCLEDFETDLKLLALELICFLAFDQRINCFDPNKIDNDNKKYVKSIDDFMELSGVLTMGLPIWKFISTKELKEFLKIHDFMIKHVIKYIDQKINELEVKNSKEYENKKTILYQLIKLKDTEKKITHDDIVSLISDFIIAGVDTTSNSLHFALYELGKNINIQNKLYDEISKVLENSLEVDEEKLSKMTYLKALLKETLRLHSTVPVIFRIPKEDVELEGYFIPKGTNLNMVTYHTARSSEQFKNPLEFNPDRFIGSESKKINPYSHLPFGFGSRACIGRRVTELYKIFNLISSQKKI